MRSPLTLGIASGALDIDVVDGPREVTRDREYGYAVHPRVGLSATIEAVGSRPDPLRFALRFVATPVLGLGARSAGQSTPVERFGAVVAAAEARELVDVFLGSEYLGRFVIARIRETRRDPAGLVIDADIELLASTSTDGPTAQALPYAAAAVAAGASPQS